jgi:3-dehydroquinate dehydratase II
MRVLVLNGPNLDMLGAREPDVYGHFTLTELNSDLIEFAIELGMQAEVRQTNSEAELIDWLHEAFSSETPVVINPAAFTHYSYALRDACAMLTKKGVSLIEVHISNPHSRESFRHNSVISGVASGVIAGFGLNSYRLALQALARD